MLLWAVAAAAALGAPSGARGRDDKTFVLTDFGAKGDNATLNTEHFVAAVQAVATANGGTLVVPGGVFRTGPFNLTSNMVLYLDKGATILGPTVEQLGSGPQFDMWPVVAPMPSYGQGRDHIGPRRTAFIGGMDLTNVTVTSDEDNWGTIDGFGEPWWACHCGHADGVLEGCSGDWNEMYPCHGVETVTRGHLIEFMHSTHIEISNLYLRNSPFWTVHPFDCHHVTIRNIDIYAPAHSPNTDGVDPDSSTDVLIENFRYHGGDDVIAIKSGWDCFGYEYNHSTRDIVIRNVTAIYSEAAGTAIGSEMSGGMANITISDCDFTQTATGLDIKYSQYRGGYVTGIHYRNIVMGNQSRAALTVNSNYGSKNPSCSKELKPVPCPVSSITYENITQAPGTSVKALIDFEGLDSNTIMDVYVDGLHLDLVGSDNGVKCSKVQGTYKDCVGCAQCAGLTPA
mmetsp:Transcript_19200/g.57082  ORF Transcript_19200/g.57082 Transcript_19200/m.57082 type:complete len:455 (+) Transcript_19200:41-1405(+)